MEQGEWEETQSQGKMARKARKQGIRMKGGKGAGEKRKEKGSRTKRKG